MKFRPRLIPSVILAATVLLGLKVSDIFAVGGHALAQAPSTNQATGAPLDLTSQAKPRRRRRKPTRLAASRNIAGREARPAKHAGSATSAAPQRRRSKRRRNSKQPRRNSRPPRR